MRKNGSRLISLGQYRFTDLFLFAAILVGFDCLSHFAAVFIPEAAMYFFTLTVPIVLIIMMRWSWWAALFAAGDAIVLTALNNPTVWQSYLASVVGALSILAFLPLILKIGKKRVTGKWYFCFLLVAAAWFLMALTNSFVQFLCGEDFVAALVGNLGFGLTGMVSLFVGEAVILVVRNLDGMFVDQVEYLKARDEERKQMQRRDEFGDEEIELDEETLSILRKRDDGLDK